MVGGAARTLTDGSEGETERRGKWEGREWGEEEVSGGEGEGVPLSQQHLMWLFGGERGLWAMADQFNGGMVAHYCCSVETDSGENHNNIKKWYNLYSILYKCWKVSLSTGFGVVSLYNVY